MCIPDTHLSVACQSCTQNFHENSCSTCNVSRHTSQILGLFLPWLAGVPQGNKAPRTLYTFWWWTNHKAGTASSFPEIHSDSHDKESCGYMHQPFQAKHLQPSDGCCESLSCLLVFHHETHVQQHVKSSSHPHHGDWQNPHGKPHVLPLQASPCSGTGRTAHDCLLCDVCIVWVLMKSVHTGTHLVHLVCWCCWSFAEFWPNFRLRSETSTASNTCNSIVHIFKAKFGWGWMEITVYFYIAEWHISFIAWHVHHTFASLYLHCVPVFLFGWTFPRVLTYSWPSALAFFVLFRFHSVSFLFLFLWFFFVRIITHILCGGRHVVT